MLFCVLAAYGYGVSAVPLLYTMRHTMIRHTKAQTIQGQSVLALPEKTEDLVPGEIPGGGAEVLRFFSAVEWCVCRSGVSKER